MGVKLLISIKNEKTRGTCLIFISHDLNLIEFESFIATKHNL